MTRWSLFLQTLSLLHHFLGLYSVPPGGNREQRDAFLTALTPRASPCSTDSTREARVLQPERRQLQWVPRDLETAVPQDHPTRAIWRVLSFRRRMDLSGFYGAIEAVVERPGVPLRSPRCCWPCGWMVQWRGGQRKEVGEVALGARCLLLAVWWGPPQHSPADAGTSPWP